MPNIQEVWRQEVARGHANRDIVQKRESVRRLHQFALTAINYKAAAHRPAGNPLLRYGVTTYSTTNNPLLPFHSSHVSALRDAARFFGEEHPILHFCVMQNNTPQIFRLENENVLCNHVGVPMVMTEEQRSIGIALRDAFDIVNIRNWAASATLDLLSEEISESEELSERAKTLHKAITLICCSEDLAQAAKERAAGQENQQLAINEAYASFSPNTAVLEGITNIAAMRTAINCFNEFRNSLINLREMTAHERYQRNIVDFHAELNEADALTTQHLTRSNQILGDYIHESNTEIRHEINELRGDMDARMNRMDARMNRLEDRMERVETEITAMRTSIDDLRTLIVNHLGIQAPANNVEE